MNDKSIIKEQIKYYRDRASEYDQWHLRLGRYDRGEDQKRRWFSELNTVRSALKQAEPLGECLELACGTGLWTAQLADGATSLTAIDAVLETIEINRAKLNNKSIKYEIANLFEWRPAKTYDFIFFGFWLSHIPPDRFDRFWKMVKMALKPDGRESTARDHAPVSNSGIVERKLNNGQTYDIVKIFYKPDQLNQQLQALGWTGTIQKTGQFFYYGKMTPKM